MGCKLWGMTWESISQMTAELAEGRPVQGALHVIVVQKTPRTTKNGKPYLEVQLADPESNLTLKVWENLPWYPALQNAPLNSGIAMSATWSNSSFGVEVTEVNVRSLTAEEEDALLIGNEQMRKRQQAAWESICSMAQSIRDPRLSELCNALLERHGARFRRAAAARGYHHARRGGLVEHTAGVMRTAAALCQAYPEVNRDLLLAGALFHDCGKMWENGFPEHGLVMPYSDAGELLGHISLGIEVINKLWAAICTEERLKKWADLTPDSEQVRLHLLHLVASHHGSVEFGSPVVPKTPEAFMLHHADDLDAKMEMLREAYESSPQLSARIRQRKMPLPGNVAEPLPGVSHAATGR